MTAGAVTVGVRMNVKRGSSCMRVCLCVCGLHSPFRVCGWAAVLPGVDWSYYSGGKRGFDDMIWQKTQKYNGIKTHQGLMRKRAGGEPV